MENFTVCATPKAMHPQDKRDAWIRKRAQWSARRCFSKNSEKERPGRMCLLPLFDSHQGQMTLGEFPPNWNLKPAVWPRVSVDRVSVSVMYQLREFIDIEA